MTTINPSIDQGALETFQRTFFELAQQKQSRLEGSGVLFWLPSTGKTNNFARMGKVELSEVDGRNPLKQYSDYALDNRMLTKRRFTRSILLDEKDDVNELLIDPKSQLMSQLLYAKNRAVDRIITRAAINPVLVGRPDRQPTAVSAAEDGVQTIDATSGLTYQTIEEIIQNFINSDIDIADYQRAIFLGTGKENTALMDEEKFINNRYVDARPVEQGVAKKASTFGVTLFAGSEAGGIVVPNPVLPETETTRTCLALCPESIAMAMEVNNVRVARNENYVNSFDLTVDLWINAMRTEGSRVQAITTTK